MSRRGVGDDRRTVQERLLEYRKQRDARAARTSAGRVIHDSDSSGEEESFVSARSVPDSGLGGGGQEGNPQPSSGDEETVSSRPCSGPDAAAGAIATAGAPGDDRAGMPGSSSPLASDPATTTRTTNSETPNLVSALDRLTLAPAGQPDPGRTPLRADSPTTRQCMPESPVERRAAAPTHACLATADIPAAPTTLVVPAAQAPAPPSGDGSLVLGSFKLRGDLASKLYPYQREGVSWLWRLYQLKTGGILADDMGLGKTMQCCAFLAGMLESGLLRRALVVAPKTLLAHWKGELQVCGLSQRTHEFVTGTSPGAQTRALKSTAGGCGILLTTYGMLQHNAPSLASHPSHDADEGALWDLMILDEGHKLKNPKTELRHKCDYIPARSRVVISGTPIQNNLRELWALFDFTTPDLLGNANSFKDVYEKWILAGNDRSAMPEARERGAAAAAQLRTRIAPYMLRREKGAMHAAKEGENAAPGAATIPAETERALPKWTHKSDFIIWLQLKPLQLSLYQAFLSSPLIKSVLNSSRSALGALTVLKKICDHPALVSERAQREMMAAPTTDEAGQAADADVETSEEVAVLTEDCPTWLGAREEEGLRRLLAAVDESTFLASCKTEFVLGLLRHLVGSGHKTLVFSQSTKMLTILETAIRKEGVRMVRIDGQVASVDERAARVHAFQTCPDILVFLLSSAVGGLGLTLTAADRVIIVDPAWNPAVDNQAVDRAYRIGQQRDVVVYRLISCGTLEEKIYRKQVFKAGLSRTGTEDGEQHKYFAQQELRDLLKLDLAEVHASPTLRILNEMHAGQRRLTPQLSEHLRFLETLAGFAGVSDHDLLYTEKEANPVKLTQRVEEDYRKAAAAPPGTVSAPASIKGRAGGSATKKAAAKGWVGEGELSEKFARAMDLHRGSGESRAPFQPPRRAESSAAEAAAVALAGLRQALAKQRQLLTNAALLSGLADGGARVRRRVAELEAEVAQAEAVLARHAPPSGALTDASTEDKSSSVAPEATSAVRSIPFGLPQSGVRENAASSGPPVSADTKQQPASNRAPAEVSTRQPAPRWPPEAAAEATDAARAPTVVTGPKLEFGHGHFPGEQEIRPSLRIREAWPPASRGKIKNPGAGLLLGPARRCGARPDAPLRPGYEVMGHLHLDHAIPSPHGQPDAAGAVGAGGSIGPGGKGLHEFADALEHDEEISRRPSGHCGSNTWMPPPAALRPGEVPRPVKELRQDLFRAAQRLERMEPGPGAQQFAKEVAHLEWRYRRAKMVGMEAG
ncbi:hypothetical protein ACKKBF_B05055 [Auxenochlorella protothecoides x Auxenochlorella symbiontica]